MRRSGSVGSTWLEGGSKGQLDLDLEFLTRRAPWPPGELSLLRGVGEHPITEEGVKDTKSAWKKWVHGGGSTPGDEWYRCDSDAGADLGPGRWGTGAKMSGGEPGYR